MSAAAKTEMCLQDSFGFPGGLWQDNLDGHEIGRPVLQTTHHARYQVFFYSNSAAFVTSLVLVMMVQSKFLLTLHTLEGCMVLDLICLVTAYAAGSTRDAKRSIYVVIVIGLILIYIAVHVCAVGLKENVVAEPVPVPVHCHSKKPHSTPLVQPSHLSCPAA